MNIFQTFLGIVYPDLCFACRDLVGFGDILCIACLATVNPIASRIFPLSGRREMMVHAVGAYDEALQKIVAAKFRRSLPAARAMGRLMAELLPQKIFDVDLIVPVPLYWQRYADRGYNQAVEIAKSISAEVGVPYRSLLMRHKKTKFQYLLSRDERRMNVENVFSIRPDVKNFPIGMRILLVDDLCTSGVTLQEAGKALCVLKPSFVNAAVCARALI